MSQESLPMGEAIQFGWQALKKNFASLALISGLVFLIQIGAIIVITFVSGTNQSLANLLGLLLQLAYQSVVPCGITNISLKLCDEKPLVFEDVIAPPKLILFYFLGSILFAAILFPAFLLLIVPGIYLSLRFGYFGYYIVDHQIDPIEAVKRSWEDTRGRAGSLFIFWLLLALINLLGFLCLFVGLLVTIPLTTLANAFIYRVLSQKNKGTP